MSNAASCARLLSTIDASLADGPMKENKYLARNFGDGTYVGYHGSRGDDAMKPASGPAATRAGKADRTVEENARLDCEADREFDEGRGIPLKEVVDWVRSWLTPHETPRPKSRKLWLFLSVARAVRFSDAAVRDLEHIRIWLTQPGAGLTATVKLADLPESLSELPDTALRYPIDPDRPLHRYVALHG